MVGGVFFLDLLFIVRTKEHVVVVDDVFRFNGHPDGTGTEADSGSARGNFIDFFIDFSNFFCLISGLVGFRVGSDFYLMGSMKIFFWNVFIRLDLWMKADMGFYLI